jgi:alpha-L-fucosidase
MIMKRFILVLLVIISAGCQGQRPAKSDDAPDRVRGIILPKTDHHYGRVKSYVEDEPDADYLHASKAAHEAFKDMKYGVRIHFGLYSILQTGNESWPFLKMDQEGKHRYQQLYRQFNPQGFDAEEWMQLFQQAGLKCFAITAKHHEGFSLFDTQARVKQRVNWLAPGGPALESCDLAYSVMDAPFKRDIIKELCEAARKRDIRIDLYFSHPDWYDADFRPYNYHPLQTESACLHPQDYGSPEMWEATVSRNSLIVKAPERSQEETKRMVQRHRTQILELLTNYGQVDMMCLDQWMGKDAWPAIKETIKMARKLQPDIMFRARGIGNYGDYYTPEGFVPGSKENTQMPWMVIYPLGSHFSYEADSSLYKGAKWIIHNLVDAVAKGGNFMVGIGPDGSGRFHATAIRQLREAGEWLRINGEAIYGTRELEGDLWKQGDSLRFTRTKTNSHVYAISFSWPGKILNLKSVVAREGGVIRLLGHHNALTWQQTAAGLLIELPADLQDLQMRPSQLAYTFSIPLGSLRH